jgi:hypothetical protein
MSGPFIVVGRSRLKPGKADAYAAWRTEMFREVEEQEPRLLAFNEWDSDDDTSSVVIQVHPDAESFEYHLKLFGERVQEALDYIEALRSTVRRAPLWNSSYGVTGMRITVHPLHKAGFTRLQGGERRPSLC